MTAFNWYEMLSPAAILISAGGAWWFAYASIKKSENTAKKQSTFDYLSKLSWDKDYINAKTRFISIKLGPKKLRAVAEEYERLKNNGQSTPEADGTEESIKTIEDHSAIKNILNEYEALAIAIKTGALDPEMIRQNIQQQFVDHIDSCNGFIDHTRKNTNLKKPDRIWCEVQALADKWRNP